MCYVNKLAKRFLFLLKFEKNTGSYWNETTATAHQGIVYVRTPLPSSSNSSVCARPAQVRPVTPWGRLPKVCKSSYEKPRCPDSKLFSPLQYSDVLHIEGKVICRTFGSSPAPRFQFQEMTCIKCSGNATWFLKIARFLIHCKLLESFYFNGLAVNNESQ